MFRKLSKVHNEIHKPVCKLRIWLASFTSVTNQGLFYKLACEFQYELRNELANFPTKFGTFVVNVSRNWL
jgi:hypothetical protein